jgi:hypothetical protein
VIPLNVFGYAVLRGIIPLPTNRIAVEHTVLLANTFDTNFDTSKTGKVPPQRVKEVLENMDFSAEGLSICFVSQPTVHNGT